MATGYDDVVLVGGEQKDAHPVVIAALDAGGKAHIGAIREPAATVHSASGSIASGKQSVLLIPSSDFEGTILGEVLNVASLGFEARQGEAIGAIPFTITAGTLTSITL